MSSTVGFVVLSILSVIKEETTSNSLLSNVLLDSFLSPMNLDNVSSIRFKASGEFLNKQISGFVSSALLPLTFNFTIKIGSL